MIDEALCMAGGGGIYCTSRDFVKRCFAIPLGVTFAFVAELLAVIFALKLLSGLVGIIFGLKVIHFLLLIC